MEWKEVPSESKWVLEDNGDTAAMIILVDKESITNRYQTKAILSAIYLGKKRFARLDKTKRDWLASRRKFSTRERRDRYVESKKRELVRYIAHRIG